MEYVVSAAILLFPIVIVLCVIIGVEKKIRVAKPELAPAIDIVVSLLMLLIIFLVRTIVLGSISSVEYSIDSRIITILRIGFSIPMLPCIYDLIVTAGPYMIILMQHLYSNATFLLVRFGVKRPQGYVIFSYQMDEEIGFCSGECAICLMEYATKDTCALLDKCGHTFHHLCLHKYLTESTRCPLCRQNIKDCALKIKNLM
ncbi:hypothetical protein M0R45_003419 [Rubus argutus]|uniref:RING-type domain-containing protein n=1 Tax=Rubus argutus TaxID=59490 RepID=A0AAW1YHR2_RUBAR